MRTKALRLVLAIIAALLVTTMMAACDDDDAGDAGSPTPVGSRASVSGKITVLAASSLTDSFTQIAKAFEAANPGATVEFQFGGSPTLVTQLGQGAPGDVLATADEKNMQNAVDQSLVVDAGKTFARNRLVIIVPKSNPGGVQSAADLAKPGLKLVLAAKDVPVGNYARQALDKYSDDGAYGSNFATKVLANLVSDEPNVKAVVTKIQLGEADAGIVYVTDVTAGVAGDITSLEIADRYNVIATYPIAVTKDAGKPDVAQAFIDFVLSDAGQATLKKFGFISVQ